MKKKEEKIVKKKLLGTLMVATLVMASLTGCGSSKPTETAATTTEDASTTAAATTAVTETTAKELSGSISLSGSTSMEKLANALAESFMNKYPNVTVSPEFTGSGAGIEAVSNGTTDIGNSSRNLKEEEKAAGAAENIVAIDGIAVIIDKANTVTDLTKDDLVSIYTGVVTNWKDLGGADAPIVVIGREAGSGTRGAFEELLEVEDSCKYASELDSTGAVIARVASTPGAIGYASLDAVDETVVAASLEGVEATADNIKAGTYFLCRPFVMATKGEISEQNELVQAFFEYIASDEGKAVIEQVGLIVAE